MLLNSDNKMVGRNSTKSLLKVGTKPLGSNSRSEDISLPQLSLHREPANLIKDKLCQHKNQQSLPWLLNVFENVTPSNNDPTSNYYDNFKTMADK